MRITGFSVGVWVRWIALFGVMACLSPALGRWLQARTAQQLLANQEAIFRQLGKQHRTEHDLLTRIADYDMKARALQAETLLLQQHEKVLQQRMAVTEKALRAFTEGFRNPGPRR